MSIETDIKHDLALPADPLDLLQAQVKRQKLFLFLMMGLCVFALISAMAAIGLALSGNQENTPEKDAMLARIPDIENRLEGFSSELAGLTKELTGTNNNFEALSGRLAELDITDQRNAIIRLQRILIRQEQDYRNFLTNLENSLYNFHMMVPHSQGWWDEYKPELTQIVELSKARENYVANLRNN